MKAEKQIPIRISRFSFLSLLLIVYLVSPIPIALPQQSHAQAIFAGKWKGTRVQWIDGPPSSVIQWIPAKHIARFELEVDAGERRFAGFTVSSRNGRTISGQRVTDRGGCRWLETATLTVAADGMMAKFASKSVGLSGPWPCKGITVENSADLRKVQ